MLIKYRGGRTHLRVTFGRRMFHFTTENKFIVDIKDQEVRDFIFKLPNSSEFEAIEREPLKEVEILKKEVKKGAKYGQEEL
jgi:hypothetical protein